jgi:hypothetical protein
VSHTPGPWIVNVGEVPTLGGDALGVIRENHKEGEIEPSICIISRMDRLDDADRANALLISAAPDLLEVLHEYGHAYTQNELKQLAEARSGLGEISPAEAQRELRRRTAIARATGKEFR